MHLSNFLNCTYDYSFGRKKFLKIEVVEELFEIKYVKRKVKWLAMCTIENDILDTIDLNTVLDDFASKNAWRSIFL
jgi:hypothetical protein